MNIQDNQGTYNHIKDKLGIALIKKGLVDVQTIEKAIQIKEKIGSEEVGIRARRGLAKILYEDFKLDHEIIFGEVANVYGFTRIDLTNEYLGDNRLEFIKKMLDPLPQSTRDYMIKNRILAFRYDADRPYQLIIIAADPTDRMIPIIARGMKVQSYNTCYVPLADMNLLVEKTFPPENLFLKELASGDVELSEDDIADVEVDESEIEAALNKSILVNLVEGMLVEAVHMGVSDIHIVPSSGNKTEIMFRIDGMLRNWHTQEGIRPEAIAAVMKDRARGVDRFERESAQDGFIQRKIDGHNIRYRFSSMPIQGQEFQYKFESIVIRILDDRKVITDLDKLGFHGTAREMFLKAIKQPQGMIIVTGPTGSGKSTTLVAALSYIVSPEINVLTVEDPVEYIIPGVRQLKIGHKMGFEQALRGILRHDPDVVMLGEIRDQLTGQTAIKMANTGHLTFSTLHTNDAPSAVTRLYKMGIETFLIAYAINIIIAQRLARKLCENCKRPVSRRDLDRAIPLGFGFTEEEIDATTFYEAVGCDKCHGGFKGRVAIHEALYFTPEIRHLIFEAREDINEDAIREKAIEQGMMTLQATARERVKSGVCELNEISRVSSQ